MELSKLHFYCEQYSSLLSIYIRAYKDKNLDELLFITGNRAKSNSYLPPVISTKHLVTDKTISLYDKEIFILGYLRDESTGTVLIIGPVRNSELTANDVEKLVKMVGFPKVLEHDLTTFIYNTPFLTLDKFLAFLSIANYSINGTMITPQEIVASNESIRDIEGGKENYIETADMENHRPNGAYEDYLNYCIKNGLVSEIKKMSYQDSLDRVGQLGPDKLRSIKNALIILNSICLRASLSGGLDTDTAYTLGEQYVQRIEKSQTVNDFQHISSAIRLDYCQRVKNILEPPQTNIYIIKATDYIQKNIYAKITVAEIAENVGIQPEYLSYLSKKNLDMTMAQFIMKRKISEAKKLLRFTDKSLTEISNLLCFSSQSHFQRQFKSVRGITPAEYRKKYQRESVYLGKNAPQ